MWKFLQEVGQDLGVACRKLRANTGLTIAVLLTLMIGTGANAAIFSVVYHVLVKPLPYQHPDRLVCLQGDRRGRPGIHPLSFPDFREIQDQAVFDLLAAVTHRTATFIGGTRPVRISAGVVSHSFPSVLGLQPMMGRLFSEFDSHPSNPPVALLSYGLWQNSFAADVDVLDRTVELNNQSFAVVGVLPAGFRPPWGEADLWVTLGNAPGLIPGGLMQDRSFGWLEAVGLLPPTKSLQQAQEQLDRIAAGLTEKFPEFEGQGFRVLSLHDRIVGDAGLAIWVLFGSVAIVLLIACANVANLLLVSALHRDREFALRRALGASRWRLTRQLLTESLLLAALGAGCGSLLAHWILGVVIRYAAGIPRQAGIAVDSRVLLALVVTAGVTGLLFGLGPVLHACRAELIPSLRGIERRGGPKRRNLAMGGLVVFETALVTVLLIGAGLLTNSFVRLLSVDLGFEPENVLSLELNLAGRRYPEDYQKRAFAEALLSQVDELPGVATTALSTGAPMLGTYAAGGFMVEGQSERQRAQNPRAFFRMVSPEYFETLGIPLVSGQLFDRDDVAGSTPVILINERMAKAVFGGVDPVGQRIRVSLMSPEFHEIVGVVRDVRQFQLEAEVEPEIYYSLVQHPGSSLNLLVRYAANPLAGIPDLRQVVWRLDEEVPISRVQTLRQNLSGKVAEPRFHTLIVGLFTAIALILSVVGVYAVISYSVNLRRRELGIRMAIGASRHNILQLVLFRGLMPALSGLILGVVAALGLTQFLKSFLFEIRPTDPLTFVAAGMVLFVVAAIACLVPARQATRIDPREALSCE